MSATITVQIIRDTKRGFTIIGVISVVTGVITPHTTSGVIFTYDLASEKRLKICIFRTKHFEVF